MALEDSTPYLQNLKEKTVRRAPDGFRECRICGEVKPLDGFEINYSTSALRTIYRKQCKECRKVYMRHLYATSPEERARRKAWSAGKRRFRKYKIIEYLQSHPCVDCGEADIVVLDFDHVETDKKACISEMCHSSANWHKIEEEIAKCVVRCANCHRRRTAKQQGWLKWFLR